MAKGTTFGTIHSDLDLHLIQQKVEVQPAKPKTKYVDIPGGNGSKDLTEALGVGVKYADREIVWTYALYPDGDWYDTQRRVSGAINGLACHITLDDDPDFYYDGRVTVDNYASDKLLRQITVKATCRPYKKRQYDTVITRNDLTTSYKAIALANDRMPVVPAITVGQLTTVKFNGNTYSLTTGTIRYLDICLVEGVNTLEAKTGSGTGSISIAYREGAL